MLRYILTISLFSLPPCYASFHVEEQTVDVLEFIHDTIDRCPRSNQNGTNITLLDATIHCFEHVVTVLEKSLVNNETSSRIASSNNRSYQINGGIDRVKQITANVHDAIRNSVTIQKEDNLSVEGRGRRHKNMMMSLMMFGIIAVGMIMIPMGFQFLAVLGGKALLLSKMALILTSIQGLKKIATSNVNYGLYSTIPQENWNYDRQWPNPFESYGAPTGYEYFPQEQHYDVPRPLRRSVTIKHSEK